MFINQATFLKFNVLRITNIRKMKKNLFVKLAFISFLFVNVLYGQNQIGFGRLNRYYFQNVYYENNMKAKTLENKIKSCTSKTEGKKKTSNPTIQYDIEGRVVEYKRDKAREIRISYSAGNNFKEVGFYKHNRLIERDSLHWKNDKMLSSYYYNSKNKLLKQETNQYQDSMLTEHVYLILKHGKLKEKRKQVYEYYLDNSTKKITHYKNGKPRFYSVFDCNPIGENHKMKKDSAYNCVKYDVDSLGNKIKVTITNNRAYSWKTVEYFNSKDECIARKTFDVKGNNQLMWAYYYTSGVKYFTKFVSFNKRNKEIYKIENVFDNAQNCTIACTYRHGRFKSKTTQVFNEKGLLINAKVYNKH
jgi:hypothetical protein